MISADNHPEQLRRPPSLAARDRHHDRADEADRDAGDPSRFGRRTPSSSESPSVKTGDSVNMMPV